MSMKNPTEEERVTDGIVFARTLKIGVWLSLVLVVITFLLYVFDIVPAHVPVDQLPKYWSLSASEYQRQTGTQPGMGQIKLNGDSDLLCLMAIALLSTISLVSLAAVLTRYVARRDLIYAIIAALNIAILVLAACGVF
jgi:uncharacterized membrane protein